MRNLLAWNFSPSHSFGYQLFDLSGVISDLPLAPEFQFGTDVRVNPGFDFFAMPVPQAGSSKIVFTSNRDGNAEIYCMNADGSGLIRLTTNAFNDDHPRWAPDGTKILFQSDRDNPETGNADVYLMNADGSDQTRLTTEVADDSAAVWSPDGSKIVFQSLRNGQYYQVFTMNADGANQANLSNGIAADYQPSWSPNGLKIAFASERDQAGRPSVYVMNANGLNQTRLTFSSEPFRDEQPNWSRDATKIAFVSTRDSVIETWQETDDEGGLLNRSRVNTNKEIYKMNADGSNQIRLTNTLENDDSPSWSPDGTQIIFRSERERDEFDPAEQLWTMYSDGTGQGLISGNVFGDHSPSWNTSAANQPPIAAPGGPYSGIVAQNVPFDGSASFDPEGAITSYSWNFGDGGAGGTGAVPTHTYAAAGTYTVTLTVTDNLGAQASANTSITITTAGSEQYLANFNVAALARTPFPNESAYWNDILRAAYANGQNSMLLSIREMGKTLFESSDYAARGRNNHWYVYDLYKTYLMREPDAPGWAFWEACAAPTSMGREAVRRAFDESGEFAAIVATLTPTGSPSSTVSSLASARVDPFNQPGNGLTSRDTNWSVPLLSLPGRAGLDLGLSLSYSSMVWTRSGPYIYFDEDVGSPSPGFRLGFPTIQEKYFDAQAGDNVYLLVAGARVSLRQVGTSNVYEAADSSYLQLIDDGGSLLVRSTDGTQLTYLKFENEWRCTQVKDRNGNFITVNYDGMGQLTTITDTLARTITFNYDGNDNLLSITQGWTVNGVPTTHEWATFGWETRTVQSSSSAVMATGAFNGSMPMLNQVGLNDGSRYNFEYTAAGQVNRIRRHTSDTLQRSYTAYDYQSIADDCPRLSATRVSAENWTGINGVPNEVVTIYSDPGDGSHTVTAPDGTLYKEFYAGSAGFQPAGGWARGLVAQTEVWSAGIRQKWTTNTWTQDNTGVSYQTNPRVTETNVHDASNHRRTAIEYQTFTLPSGASCSLPSDTREFAGSASTALRHSHTSYRMDPVADATYLNLHILGLVKELSLFEVNGSAETLMSKVGFQYDETGTILGNDTPVGRDNSYDSNFVIGRANLTSVKRYDVNDTSQFTMSSMKYNTSGSVVSRTDALGHSTTVSYADSFSDGNNNRNTLAYPKTVTDADGYSSTVIYNFDFGVVTSKQTPQPNTTANLPGPVQTFLYDDAGRIKRITAVTNGAYQRFEYGPNYLETWATVNNVADEAYSNTVFDGAGRTIAAARNHPGSASGYSAVMTVYDRMGRAIRQSNPTETTASGTTWPATGDDAYNAQTGEGDWRYTEQTYDWQGRPLITTNTDGTTKEASYSGCGCAGGAVVTFTDEGTLDAGVFKRRQQKIYSDVFGRTVKTELLHWQGGTPYSSTVNIYNARDQVTLARQYAGPEGSATYQDTVMSYDGYGRLKTKHVPEQDANTATTYEYKPDDTIEKVTDARGASTTYGYNNNRHLVNTITYSAPSGIASTPNVSFEYDAVGNRTSMTDGLGSVSYGYNQLSQMASETRTINGVGVFPLSYDYSLASELKTIIDPWGATINYGFDSSGRLNNITGTGYGSVSQLLSNMQYRAWGTLRSETYGNGFSAVAAYNGRLHMTSFRVSKPTGEQQMSGAYHYYADGQVKLSNNPLDERFDRAYANDHGGRVTEAYSGSEARDFINGTQSGAPTGPYGQSYQYNQFNQVTQHTNRLWDATETVMDSFANNRRAGWIYDADGRILADDTTTYTRDAVGQIVAAASEGASRTNKFDGSGRMVWTSLTTQFRNHPRTRVTYYLTSAVLGGLATAELNSTGQKTKGNVYAGGRKLAEEAAGSVTWAHADPVTASRGDSTASGGFFQKAEYNADGVNVGFINPVTYEEAYIPEPGLNGLLLSLGSGCSVADPTCQTCYLDGFEHDCGRINSETTQQCPDNDCGPRSIWDPDSKRFVGVLPLTTNPDTGGWMVRGTVDQYSKVDIKIGGEIFPGEWKRAGNREVAFFLGPQKPAPGSFWDCFQRSGLGRKHVKGQAADGKLFTKEAADLLLAINKAEGTSLSLLAVTLMNENTSFNLWVKPMVNVDSKGQKLSTTWWDVGPFQLNQHYIARAIIRGTIKNDGDKFLNFADIFGLTPVKKDQPFTGSPLANGRIAARWLDVAGGNDRQRAINYAQRAGRGPSYDSFAPLFGKFFECYKP